MVASGDKERVRTLLKDTITLLCRNGLTFKAKFNIEALIGVTLDDDDIFLVSINELVKTEAFKEAEHQEIEKSQDVGQQISDGASCGDESVSEKRRKRKRKKIIAVKTALDTSVSRENNQLQEDVEDNVKMEQDIKKQRTSAEPLSQPEGAGYDDDNDSSDIVFVKQEQELWSEQSANPSQITYNSEYQSQPPGPDVKFSTSSADMNLVPLSANEDPGMMWSPGQQQMTGYQRRLSTVTSDGVVAGDPGDQTQPGAPQDEDKDGQYPEHLSTLKKEKNYKCDVCGYCTAFVSSLKVHKRTHTGERPYSCTVCGKSFTQSGDLTRHLAIHSGEKKYKCDLCGYCTINAGNLKEHKRIHSGERPYNCTVCGKGFRRSGNLNQHIIIHSGVKKI